MRAASRSSRLRRASAADVTSSSGMQLITLSTNDCLRGSINIIDALHFIQEDAADTYAELLTSWSAMRKSAPGCNASRPHASGLRVS
jgi:hypothetical protein